MLEEDFFPTATVGWTSHQAGGSGSATPACLCGWVVDGSCPPPLPRTNRTSLVPPLVLSGHAASLYLPAQVCQDVLWQEILDEAALQGIAPHPGYAELATRCLNVNAGIFTAPRPTSRAGAHIRDAVILHWDPTSFCPSMQPGASWGIYSANATEHWLTSNASLQGRFSFQDCLGLLSRS